MQEVINLVSVIRKDIENLRSLLSSLSMTHGQYLSEEWITAEQVMVILKIGISTFKTLRRSGKLPYSKIKGLLYFRTIDIENLLKQHYINPSSKEGKKMGR